MPVANIFDSSLPSPAFRSGVQTADDMRNNQLALRDSVLMGGIAGFQYSRTIGTGTAEEPQYEFLKNGLIWIRATMFYSGIGNPATSFVEVSTDGGTSYSSQSAVAYALDSALNPTGSSGGGGGASLHGAWLVSLIGKFKQLRASVLAHFAATTASRVHGMGTLAAQDASAVAITGGNATLDRLIVGGIRGAAPSSGTAAGAVTLDWRFSSYALVVSGPLAFTWANLPGSAQSAGLALHIYNPSGYTITWPTPLVWTSATPIQPGAQDLFAFWARDGNVVLGGRSFTGLG
jgi:hypothetical protein